MASVKKQIKNATKATNTKVSTDYTPGAYAAENSRVDTTTEKNVNNATTQAESAYKMATANNQQRAEKSHSTNATVTKQIGRTMKSQGYSQTNRNISGAATARSASTINAARTNADRNAQAARDTATSKAQQSAYQMAAKSKSSNTKADIERSTQQNKTKAQQTYQSAEAQKARDLTNALNKREDKFTKKKEKYAKSQRQLKSYTDTLATRYTSVKAIDRAIKKAKKSNTAYKKTKIAYLQALRAQFNQAGKSGSGSGGGGRRGGGRRGWGRRYGSSGSSSSSGGKYTLNGGGKNGKGGKSKGNSLNPKDAGSPDVTNLWTATSKPQNIAQPSAKKQDKKAKTNKAATSVRWRGTTVRKNGKKK